MEIAEELSAVEIVEEMALVGRVVSLAVGKGLQVASVLSVVHRRTFAVVLVAAVLAAEEPLRLARLLHSDTAVGDLVVDPEEGLA